MIRVNVTGEFKKTEKFLNNNKKINLGNLAAYAEEGRKALMAATPVKTGATAASWGYKIENNKNGITIAWTNTNLTESGIPVAILIQYGHGTRHGAYVQGVDYINPALQPVFESIAERVWKEVNR